jgi:hypothetical protein
MPAAGVQIQAIKKCGFLRQLTEKAKSGAATLHDTLVSAQGGHFVSTFQRGRLVVSQAGSGQSGSFEVGVQGKEWTQDNVFGLIEELLQMLEAADAVLYPDDSQSSSTDALRELISGNIMAGNVPSGVRSVMGDFTLINIPIFGTGMSV